MDVFSGLWCLQRSRQTTASDLLVQKSQTLSFFHVPDQKHHVSTNSQLLSPLPVLFLTISTQHLTNEPLAAIFAIRRLPPSQSMWLSFGLGLAIYNQRVQVIHQLLHDRDAHSSGLWLGVYKALALVPLFPAVTIKRSKRKVYLIH